MHEVWVIIRREFLTRVHTRAFLVGTILFPILTAGILFLPTLSGGTGGDRVLVIVDETGTVVGAALARILEGGTGDEGSYRYRAEVLRGAMDTLRPGLNARVARGEIDGYVVLPADVLTENRVQYRAANIANRLVLRDVTRTASQAIYAERLRRTGMTTDELVTLLAPVEIDEAEIRGTGEEGRGAVTTFLYAYLVAFLNYFMVVMYGVSVMRSVLEEKSNRISEVLVSSVRATDLMLGKIVGVSAAALLQVGIWAALFLGATRSETLSTWLRLPVELFAGASLSGLDAFLFVNLFLLGFLLFAALFAALGAAVTTEQEAQYVQMLVILPLVVPILFLGAITNEPNAPLATVLSLVPLSSPIALPMRMATTTVPPVQVAAAIVILIATVVAAAWLAGRIYRIGILATGRRPTAREVVRWMRRA
jgi:ABC-2 type transport system permease protein